MIKTATLNIIVFLFFTSWSIPSTAQFLNISPLPGSKYHNPETTLIFRISNALEPSSVYQKGLMEINGSISGMHDWTPVLSEGRTLIIKPTEAFAFGETVQVVVRSLLKRKDGSSVNGLSFSFEIRNELTADQKAILQANLDDDLSSGEILDHSSATREECSTDSLPEYLVTINNNPTPGQLFHNNQSDDKKDTNSFPAIINNDGSLVWTCDEGLNGHDFKVNYNGYMTYFNYQVDGWMVMDSNFVIIDSVQCGNGYESETNGHDIIMYPDGHTFVIAFNPQTVDMSEIVEGGKTDALVKGLIIQELDADKEVIFQWRSWDHFLITDINPTEDLTAGIIDLVHGNAVERDTDGNLLLSSRNMSEITKINLENGDLIWRMGGKNNQFTFVNDNIPGHFNYQHDIRRLPNGDVTLFNNAVNLPVQQSGAKEYQLDEINKVATLIWHYEHPKVNSAYVFGTGSGSVQRFSNGNTLISWGKTINSTPDIPNYTEVDTNGNIVWEFKFLDNLQRGYRVHRYRWQPCAIPDPEHVVVKKITSNSVKIHWNVVHNAIAYDVQYRKLGKTNWKVKNVTNPTKKLINLKAESAYEFQLRSYCQNGYASDWSKLDTFVTAEQKIFLTAPVTNVALFPNPAADILNMSFTSSVDQPLTVSIYDVTGKLIMERDFVVNTGETTLNMNVSSLPGGYYIAEFKSSDLHFVRKFVKQ